MILSWLFISLFSHALVSEPLHCWKKKNYPCALRTSDRAQVIQLGPGRMILASHSSLLINEKYSARLLSGSLMLESSPQWVVRANTILTQGAGMFWVSALDAQQIQVASLQSSVEVSRVNGDNLESLPAGIGNWYSGLTSEERLRQGMMSPLNLKSAVMTLSKVLDLSSSEIKKLTLVLTPTLSSSVEYSSELYQSVALQRQLASERKLLEIEKIERERVEEQQKLRNMFRQKFYQGS